MIKVDDEYLIEADENSYNVYRLADSVSKKTGETKTIKVLVGYYGRLEDSIKACRADAIQRHVAKEETESLAYALKVVRSITDHFERALSDAEK